MSLSIKELDKRMSFLESQMNILLEKLSEEKNARPPSPDFFEKIDNQHKLEQKKESEEILKEVETKAAEVAREKNVSSKSKLPDIIDFVVEFVEQATWYVPRLTEVIVGGFRGDIKLSLALDILTKIFTDVTWSLDKHLLKDLVEHSVTSKFKKLPGGFEIEKAETTAIEVDKKKARTPLQYFISLQEKRRKGNRFPDASLRNQSQGYLTSSQMTN